MAVETEERCGRTKGCSGAGSDVVPNAGGEGGRLDSAQDSKRDASLEAPCDNMVKLRLEKTSPWGKRKKKTHA